MHADHEDDEAGEGDHDGEDEEGAEEGGSAELRAARGEVEVSEDGVDED